MKEIISFLKENRTLFLIGLIPFSILFLGNSLLGNSYYIQKCSTYLNVESYHIFGFIALIPWLFVRENPFFRKVSIFLMIIWFSPLKRISEWLLSNKFGQYLSSLIEFNIITLTGLILCITGLFYPKTRVISAIIILLAFLLYKK